jgi:N,N'-diacetyllegionaminate synthase
MKPISVAEYKIGAGNPCFLIAEAGVNHNGQVEMAHQLIDAAIDAKADAIKFQTYRTDLLVTEKAEKAAYQMSVTGSDESQADMLRRYELTEGDFAALKAHCDNNKILFLSSAFDAPSVDLLVRLGVPALKFGSGELTNLPLLASSAACGLPIILSTGMSTLGEVEQAVNAIRLTGCKDLILLHCTSNYPADPKYANLKAIQTLQLAFGAPVGYSDHTVGNIVTLGAVAFGACVVEKHFTLDRNLPGPDQTASLQPMEFKELVDQVRVLESALGDGIKMPAPGEEDTARAARKSIVASLDISRGTRLTESCLEIKRPGAGLPPSMLSYVIGLTARVDIAKGDCIQLEKLS